MQNYEELTLSQLMNYKDAPASWYWIGIAHMGDMDMDSVIEWLTKAVNDEGNEQRNRAILDLARYCYMAEGHPNTNRDEALRLLEKISRAPIARLFMGFLYYFGTETQKDTQKGRELVGEAINFFREKNAIKNLGVVDLYEVALLYRSEGDVNLEKEFLQLTLNKAVEDGFPEHKKWVEERLQELG